MNIVEISKVLSNQTRLDILEWLKDPAGNFPPHLELGHFDFGVCVVFIKDKADLSQSTISQYLSQMERAELLISTRVGKWTYFQRNENKIAEYASMLVENL